VIPDETDLRMGNTQKNQDMIKLRMNCHDNEITKAICFSANSDKLFSIT
jgi:hypothetical protein